MLEDRDYMRQPKYREPGFPGFRGSWTVALLLLNTAIFVLQWIALRNPHSEQFLQDYLALSLEGLRHGQLWQFFTYQFLHTGLWHLAFNCLAIYFFGRPVEQALGPRRFLALYLASGILGGVLQMLFALAVPVYFGGAVVGASAGASGLVAAFAVLHWRERFTLLIYFIPVTLQGRTLLWLSAGLAVIGILTPHSPIANAAHLGGILTGFFYVRLWAQGRLPQWKFSSEGRPPRLQTLPPADDLSAEEFLKREVDPILDKISAQGIQSLTARERETLERARAKMIQR